MVCYAYISEEKKETYFKHIYCMLKVWDSIRNYYSRGLTRILGFDADTIVKLTILSHDLGKLARVYQEGERKYYRHEVISAYLAYTILPRVINNQSFPIDIVSNAVFLHHESIILSVYAGEIGEKLIPLSTLRKMLDEYIDELAIACELSGDPYYDRVRKEISGLDAIMSEVKKAMSYPDTNKIYSIISEIIVDATSKVGERSLVFRNKVAALLHILSVCDSVAATISRGDQRDSGTWISQQAFKGAELININIEECR